MFWAILVALFGWLFVWSGFTGNSPIGELKQAFRG